MTDKMFMGASTKQGMDIATKSREIIRGLIGDDVKDLNPAERDIVERIVHSTADPEYAKLVKISPDFVDVAITWSNMVLQDMMGKLSVISEMRK